ncbi:MAG: ribbon-helix-helix domain-containing protein [Candidatus Heimdallarchaeota archaeon]
MELVSFKAEPHLVVILDQLVSRGIFISRSALIRFALWKKLAEVGEEEWITFIDSVEKDILPLLRENSLNLPKIQPQNGEKKQADSSWNPE